MTSGFIPTNPASKDEGEISSAPFWPVIKLADLRAIMRTDGTITTERLRHAVIDAITSVAERVDIFEAEYRAAKEELLAKMK